MSRENLIEAGARALARVWNRGECINPEHGNGRWEPEPIRKCPYCLAQIVHDAIESKIRADERELISVRIDAHSSKEDGEVCGAWGGCTLPKGHNMGNVDIPEYHGISLTDTSWLLQQILRVLGDEYGPTGVANTALALVNEGKQQ